MKKVAQLGYVAVCAFLLALLLTVCDAETYHTTQNDSSRRYTLTYDPNGATSGSVPSEAEYETDKIATVSDNVGYLAKTDYVFSGWNTKAAGTGITYAAGQGIVIKHSDIKLYARWLQAATHHVLYDSNGATSGDIPVDSTYYTVGETATILANTGGLAKSGYTFGGWNTAPDGSGTSYAPGAAFIMDDNGLLLYARWLAFTFPSSISVRKGQLLTNPDQPSMMAYLYIDTGYKLYSIRSADGGATWGSALQATYTSDYFDFAAAMDGNSTILVEAVHGPNMNGTNGEAVWLSLPDGASSWSGLTIVHTAGTTALCRIPTVFRVGSNAILLGIGFDTGGGGAGNDTNAFSLYWNGSIMTGPHNVDLSVETDNPSYVHQVFGESDGTLQFLYYDNHTDFETDGGDLYSVPGSGFDTWAGSGSESRIIDQSSNEQICHGRLFKAATGKYILIYTVKKSADHTLFMRLASTVNDLGGESSVQLNPGGTNVRNLDEANGLYHTMYAVQDPTGAIHVVWEDRETIGKIWRIRIDPASNDPAIFEDITDTGTLDEISYLGGELYVSLHHSGTLTAKVVRILVP